VTTPARSRRKQPTQQPTEEQPTDRSVVAASDQTSKPGAGTRTPTVTTAASNALAVPGPTREIAERPVVSTQPVTVEKGLAIQHGTPILPARHPNLGLAPFNMKQGFVAAAARIRAQKVALATKGLESAVAADASFRTRHDDAGLRRLIRDGSLLAERLAMSLAANDVRWMAEYCEWVVPIYRRRRIALADLAAICRGMADALPADLSDDERACANRALDAADVVLRRNGRVAGDRHKRRPLLRWLYRGV
jgi:hypothetical protein